MWYAGCKTSYRHNIPIMPTYSYLPLHLAGLQFEEKLEEEVVRFLNFDMSPLLLTCEVSGPYFPSISFLLNNNQIANSTRVSLENRPPSCRLGLSLATFLRWLSSAIFAFFVGHWASVTLSASSSTCIRRVLRIMPPTTED